MSVPSALCGSPVLCRVNQVDLHQPFVRATDATHRPLLSIDFGGLADIAGKVCQGLGFPKDYARFLSITMPSLSQALLLDDLPSSHSAFQDHAAHSARWPALLRPKGSWGLGRHRARCLTVRLPMPPVRPVRETFASYGSRQRDIMGKVHFANSTERSPWSACAFAGYLCTVSRPSPSGPSPWT